MLRNKKFTTKLSGLNLNVGNLHSAMPTLSRELAFRNPSVPPLG